MSPPPKAWDTPLGHDLWPLPEEGLTVDAFMARALYDPEHGYYARPLPEPSEGDFVTAATSDILIEAMVAIAARLHAEMPRFELLEIGPGTGALLSGVLEGLAAKDIAPERVVAVDALAEQKGLPPRLEPWEDTVELVSPNRAPSIEGLVMANEVLDAMPVALFERVASPEDPSDPWREVRLHSGDDGRIHERLHPLRPEMRSAVRAEGPVSDPGHRFEHPPGLEDEVAAWSSYLHRGALVTLDYGGFPDEIFTLADGTLRGYRMHVPVHAYTLPGQVDVTADVNFHAFLHAAKEAGFEVGSYGSQGDLLLRHARPRPGGDKGPWHPQAMGERFKAVVLERGGWATRAGVVDR